MIYIYSVFSGAIISVLATYLLSSSSGFGRGLPFLYLILPSSLGQTLAAGTALLASFGYFLVQVFSGETLPNGDVRLKFLGAIRFFVRSLLIYVGWLAMHLSLLYYRVITNPH